MSTKIRKILIEAHGYKCKICSIESWLNNPITLEIDHIDGNNKNNDLTNLRFLCPNCHSQTENFRGKNINGSQKISDEEFIQALEETSNIRQALLKLGLTPKSQNYKRASKLLNQIYLAKKPIDTKNSQYGTIWINDNNINKKIKKEELPEYEKLGWSPGRLVTKLPPSIKGSFWVTNGTHNILIRTGIIPEGFWKGRAI